MRPLQVCIQNILCKEVVHMELGPSTIFSLFPTQFCLEGLSLNQHIHIQEYVLEALVLVPTSHGNEPNQNISNDN